MTKILVAAKEKSALIKIFKVSAPTVRDALNGRTSSPLSLRIRTAAIKRGGVEEKTDELSYETTHQTAAGEMTQEFSDRVKLIIDFKTAYIGIFVDDKLKVKYENPHISEFLQIQKIAQEAALDLQ